MDNLFKLLDKRNISTEFKENKWYLIGGGSAFSDTNTSYFKINNRVLYLIDCGEQNVHKIITLIKEHRSEIDNIIIRITHLHMDHVGGLSTILYACKYLFKIKPEIVSSSFSQQFRLKEFLEIAGNDESDYKLYSLIYPGMNFIDLHNDKEKILPIHVKHCEEFSSYGFYDKTNNTLITGDCKSFSNDVFKKYKIETLFIDFTDILSDVHMHYLEFEKNVLPILSKNTIIRFVHNDIEINNEKIREFEYNLK